MANFPIISLTFSTVRNREIFRLKLELLEFPRLEIGSAAPVQTEFLQYLCDKHLLRRNDLRLH